MIITDITNTGDPQILLYDGIYYCYATGSSNDEPGFHVRSSKDLIHWSVPVLCFDRRNSWGESHFWAPEVVFYQGRFLMHYTAMLPGRKGLRLGVAVSGSPLGPFTDVHGHPLFDLGYAAIDGSVLISSEGNYLYYSRDCSENIVDGIHTSQLFCARLSEDLTETIGAHTLIATPEYEFERKSLSVYPYFLWNEGPAVIAYNGLYLMNYSANCFATNDYAICLATSEHPCGPWNKSAHNPVLSSREDLHGAGHNAFFRDQSGALCTSFHVQTDPEHPGDDRRIVIGKVRFQMKNGEWTETIF